MKATARREKSLIQTLYPQLLLLSVVAMFWILSLLDVIPSPDKINLLLVDAFREYGIPIIIISSFLESLVGINAYFPGAFTILTGMSLTAGEPLKAVATYLAIYIPAYVANFMSFVIGRASNNVIEPSDRKKYWTWFLATYWHPQLASLTAFSAGANTRLTFSRFAALSAGISFVWSVLWAVAIYHLGLVADVGSHFIILFIAYIITWIIVDVARYRRR